MDESKNGGNERTKHIIFSKKRIFLTPRTRTYLRFEICPFALLPIEKKVSGKFLVLHVRLQPFCYNFFPFMIYITA